MKQSWLFEKIDTIDKSLSRLIRKKKDNPNYQHKP